MMNGTATLVIGLPIDTNPAPKAEEIDLEPYSEPEHEGAAIAYDVSGNEKAQDDTKEKPAVGDTLMELDPAVKQLIANQLEAIGEDQPSIFASFLHDSMAQTMQTYDIRHKKKEDAMGRVFYEFDDGRSPPLVIICFDTPTARLMSINKVVMPSKTFLSIVKMEEARNPKEEDDKGEAKTTGDLRSPPLILHNHLRCTTEGGKTFYIPNTKVEQLIMALSVLGKDETEDPEAVIPTPPPPSDPILLPALEEPPRVEGLLRRFLQWLW